MTPSAGESLVGLWLSWTRNSLQVERFLKTLVRLYGRHPYGLMAPHDTAIHVKALGLNIAGIGLVDGSTQ